MFLGIGWFHSPLTANRRGLWAHLEYSIDGIFDASDWNKWYVNAVCGHAGGQMKFEPMDLEPEDFSVSAAALLDVLDAIVLRKLEGLCSGRKSAGDGLLLTSILVAFEEYYLRCYQSKCKISARLLVEDNGRLVLLAPGNLPKTQIDLRKHTSLITSAFETQRPFSGIDELCYSLSLPFNNPGSMIAYPLTVPQGTLESARKAGIDLARCLGVMIAVSDQRALFVEQNLAANVPIVRPFATRLIFELVCAEYIARIEEDA